MACFRDETGKVSTARVLVMAWTLQCVALAWAIVLLNPASAAGVLAFSGSIETALIAWAGGPRIAQYIGPQIAKVGQAIGSAFRKGRDLEQGLEPTAN